LLPANAREGRRTSGTGPNVDDSPRYTACGGVDAVPKLMVQTALTVEPELIYAKASGICDGDDDTCGWPIVLPTVSCTVAWTRNSLPPCSSQIGTQLRMRSIVRYS